MKPKIKPVVLMLLGLAMVSGAYWMTRENARNKDYHRRQDFFDKDVRSLLDQEESRNREAIQRAKRKLDLSFDHYRGGVPDYAEALTTWAVKFQITKSVVKDWWSESNTAKELVTDLFNQHVVSGNQMTLDVTRTFQQFTNDLAANRNQMLSELRGRADSAKVKLLQAETGPKAFDQAFEQNLSPILESRAKQVPIVAALSFGGGWRVTEAVTQIVRSLAIRLATQAGVKGGAMAAGSGAGSLAGPLGFVAGLAVGYAVDMWMEKRFKEQVVSECTKKLNELQSAIWNGEGSQAGLSAHLSTLVNETRTAHEQALRPLILGQSQNKL